MTSDDNHKPHSHHQQWFQYLCYCLTLICLLGMVWIVKDSNKILQEMRVQLRSLNVPIAHFEEKVAELQRLEVELSKMKIEDHISNK